MKFVASLKASSLPYIACASLFATSALQAQIIVDSFDAGDFSVSGTQSFSQSIGGGEVLGGTRTVELSGTGASASVSSGSFSFTGVSPNTFTLTYGAFMQDSGAQGFLNGNWPEGWLQVNGFSSGKFQLTFSFSSSATAVSSQTITWFGGPSFVGFSTEHLGHWIGGGSADAQHVGGFQLQITALDATTSNIHSAGDFARPDAIVLYGYTAVPEPFECCALSSVGLLVFVAARRFATKRGSTGALPHRPADMDQ